MLKFMMNLIPKIPLLGHSSPDKNAFMMWSLMDWNMLNKVGKQKINSKGVFLIYLNSILLVLNFPDQNKKVGVLSGGERNRLHLAMTLKTEANVLLLDEPTNDIDVNTLRALEDIFNWEYRLFL